MEMRKNETWCEMDAPADWKGVTIEELLRGTLELPKKIVHHFRMKKAVKINNEIVPWNTKICEGDIVAIEFFEQETHDIVPEYRELQVVYEDDHVCIVNKPKGMETHPNKKGQTGTLANLVAGYFQKTNIQAKPRHIHRLDKDTTGGVIFAKHAAAGAMMDKLLADRKIKRMYLALVHGVIKEEKGTIRKPIGKDRHHGTKRRVSPQGQDATTHFQVLERRKNETLVSLELETGRTHQIRVHMSYIGHPLVGDTLYGGRKKGEHTSQVLHAYKIIFQHPITKEERLVEIPTFRVKEMR